MDGNMTRAGALERDRVGLSLPDATLDDRSGGMAATAAINPRMPDPLGAQEGRNLSGSAPRAAPSRERDRTPRVHLQMMTSSILVGCSTGRSAGFSPFRCKSPSDDRPSPSPFHS